jgi:hypothetical protein
MGALPLRVGVPLPVVLDSVKEAAGIEVLY